MQVSRKVYLPAATKWYNFWTSEPTNGGQTIEAAALIDIMLMYVRAGAIIPMGPNVQYANQPTTAPLELRIYLGADSEFTFYEDENDNYNYEKGNSATLKFK
jgi:alpha-D-xyloside xylohydrolase